MKLGFIWSGTGVAAPNFQDSAKACQARVDAQNAQGGVNGRKIDLETVDDKSSGANLTGAQDLVEEPSRVRGGQQLVVRVPVVPLPPGRRRAADRRRLRRQLLQRRRATRTSSTRAGTAARRRPASSSPTAPTWRRSSAPRRSGRWATACRRRRPASAKDTQKYAAPASGLKPVYLNTSVDFGTTDVGPDRAGAQERRRGRGVPAARRQHEPRHRAGPPAERRAR